MHSVKRVIFRCSGLGTGITNSLQKLPEKGLVLNAGSRYRFLIYFYPTESQLQWKRISNIIQSKKFTYKICAFGQKGNFPLFRFSKQMLEQIPLLRESIKEASMTDLKVSTNIVVDGVITLNDIICKTCHFSLPGWGNNWVVLMKQVYIVSNKETPCSA